MTPDPGFALSGSTLAILGSVLGVLNGAIAFLFKQLISSKDAQIKQLEAEIARIQVARAAETERLRVERDNFRDLAIKEISRRRGDQSARAGG